MKSPPVRRKQRTALPPQTYERRDDSERFAALVPSWNLDFQKCNNKKKPQPSKLNILYSSHNQCAFPQLFRYSICNFLRREFLLNVSAWDLACRQASLWLTHSSKWESFLPGGTVIPVKWWISFNVPVSNACQSKCQVLTSVITWMFDARFLLFT